MFVYLEVGGEFAQRNCVDMTSKSMLNSFMIVSVDLLSSL